MRQQYYLEIDGDIIAWVGDGKASIQYIILIRFSLSESSVIALSSEWLKLNEFECRLELSQSFTYYSFYQWNPYIMRGKDSSSDKISMTGDFNLKLL